MYNGKSWFNQDFSQRMKEGKENKKERRKKEVNILNYGLPHCIKRHIAISPIKW